MSDGTKKVALITGGNKGIGLETARQLGKLGITVLVGARDQAKGEAAAAEDSERTSPRFRFQSSTQGHRSAMER